MHVGPDCSFTAELPAFNAYLDLVSSFMKLGRTESGLAVYLPNEDNRRDDRIPDDERTPAAATAGRCDTSPSLANPKDMRRCGSLTRSSNTLRLSTVSFALAIARFRPSWSTSNGSTAVPWPSWFAWRRWASGSYCHTFPATGKRPRSDYQDLLDRLQKRVNVRGRLDDAGVKTAGRRPRHSAILGPPDSRSALFFFGHPMVREVRYPLRYGQSLCRKRTTRRIAIDFGGASYKLDLVFEPYQSLLIRISRSDGSPIPRPGVSPAGPGRVNLGASFRDPRVLDHRPFWPNDDGIPF